MRYFGLDQTLLFEFLLPKTCQKNLCVSFYFFNLRSQNIISCLSGPKSAELWGPSMHITCSMLPPASRLLEFSVVTGLIPCMVLCPSAVHVTFVLISASLQIALLPQTLSWFFLCFLASTGTPFFQTFTEALLYSVLGSQTWLLNSITHSDLK